MTHPAPQPIEGPRRRHCRSHHSTFAPKRTMRGGMIVDGKPNDEPETYNCRNSPLPLVMLYTSMNPEIARPPKPPKRCPREGRKIGDLPIGNNAIGNKPLFCFGAFHVVSPRFAEQ